MQMQWKILQPDPRLIETIQHHQDCPLIMAKVLANRGLSSPQLLDAFMAPSLTNLPSPMLLSDMDKAVARICTALQKGQKILVIGDYDADGVTATAVLVGFLESAGAQVDFHLPHRVEEGYGFSAKQVMHIAVPNRVDLIITVDCGSSSHEAVSAAKRFGIDVIITDHHTLENQAPDALAVVNPRQEGHFQDLSDLAGVGVAFYLVIALRTALRNQEWWNSRPEPNLKTFCDLVAIGTVADIVPLTGVNRVFTRTGLEQMHTAGRLGVRTLLRASGICNNITTAEDIAYRLAPRLNAAGRMSHAKLAFDLLRTDDPAVAERLAETLNVLNSRRQQIEQQIYKEAVARIESQPSLPMKRSLLLADPNWHEGVLGIVASKIATRYHRPVILLAAQDGIGKGSGRSIPQVDLFAALNHCSTLLEKFGGHRMAGGLTVQTQKINRLRDYFEEAVCEQLSDQKVIPELIIDSEILFDEINDQLLNELEQLEPYGEKNPAPVFFARNVRVTSACRIGRQHRRMTVCQDQRPGATLNAIHFNSEASFFNTTFFDQLAFRLHWNRYKGNKQIQLVVEGY